MVGTMSFDLPDEPHFRQLVHNGQKIQHAIFRDPECLVEAGYDQLLSDILSLKHRLYEALPASSFDEKGMIQEERPYICILAPTGYEFVVAAFAVLAVGAAIVPLAPAVMPEEALYFLSQCRADLLLVSACCSQLGSKIREYARSHDHDHAILCIKSATAVFSGGNQRRPTAAVVNPALTIAARRPSLVLFTSGSTGPPKGVVHTRRFFHGGYGTSPSDLSLTHRPVHWIGGLRSTLNLVISGTRQEVAGKPATEAAIWERLRGGGITILCCVIPMWVRLMEHFQRTLSGLPAAELDGYVRGARALRVARVGGAAPQPSLMRFWRETVGVPLEVTYGCTETGGPGLMTDPTTDRGLECNLGKPEPGVCVKLSQGVRGEILIKNDRQFSHYLNDDQATHRALTGDGFFRTGDCGRRVGDEYVIEGRQETDFVRFHGFKVPVLEVEMRLLELNFIAQACIVAVPDKDASTRVAALVRFNGAHPQPPGLAELRENLSTHLAQYMLPTALRVLRTDEQMPVTFTGKVLRKKVVEQFFPTRGAYRLPENVELWDLRSKGQQGAPHKAWDWAGLQGC